MVESAATRFCKMITLVRFCVRFVGVDVTDPNYKMNWQTMLSIVLTFFFYGCTIYTMYVGVVVNDDWTVILQALAMVGSCVQGMTKLLAVEGHTAIITRIQWEYIETYQEYESKGGAYTEYLHKRCQITWRLIMAFKWLYIIGVSFVVGLPITYGIVFKQKMLVMQFLVPGLDHSTFLGYILLLSVHTLCVCLGAFGNFGGDMYLFVFITNLPLLKDIFHVKILEFNELIAQKESHKEIHRVLWSLLAWHQHYISVLRRTEQIFKVTLFVQMLTGTVGILCTISCIFLGVWLAAPVYLVYSFILVYTFCGLGTIVETSNEEFADEIYAHCLWYELPVKEQKLFILMLAKAQNELALTAANVMPMSMQTAMQLTKGIYSFSMMLIRFLK